MYQSPRVPAYAPTPYSYTPSSLSATLNLDEEVKLPTATSERDLLESLAEIYGIIVTLDGLERAFNRDSVTDAEYTETCSKLIRQYKSNLADERVSREFGDLESFKREWDIDCPRAIERLKSGIPATVEHASTTHTSSPYPSFQPGAQQASARPSGPSAASLQSTIVATENFITFLDALKLGINSSDQLHPLLSEVIQSVAKVTEQDFEGRGLIVKWLVQLNGMRADEELDEGGVREIARDVEKAYAGFKAILE